MAKPHSWSLERSATLKKMSNKKLVIEGSDITSSQMMNFWRQVGNRSITYTMMSRFLVGIDPFNGNIHHQVLREGGVWANSEITPDQVEEFWVQVKNKKLTAQHLQDLMEGTDPFLQLCIDYNQKLEEMISLSKCKRFHRDITPRLFTLTGQGKLMFKPKLFDFSSILSREEVEVKMRVKLYQPANIEELLVYGRWISNDSRRMMKRRMILATKSFVQANGGKRYSPYLHLDGKGEITLRLLWVDSIPPGSISFLGVRK